MVHDRLFDIAIIPIRNDPCANSYHFVVIEKFAGVKASKIDFRDLICFILFILFQMLTVSFIFIYLTCVKLEYSYEHDNLLKLQLYQK